MKSECDFIVNEKNRIIKAIQVTYDMSEDETKKREIRGLVNACKNFNLKNALIVTYDNEDKIVQDGVTIYLVPFYKWAVESI